MATTCELIAKNVLSSTATDIDFTSIPGTYTDLLLVASTRTDLSGQIYGTQRLRINGDTGSNYSYRFLEGNGANVSSGNSTTSYIFLGVATGATATASTFASLEIYIPNYAGSTNKSLSVSNTHETNGTTAYIDAIAGLWSSTNAITSLKVYSTENFQSGSSFFLYGITRSDDNTPGTFGIQATGGDVTISGGYKYHVFKSSGTFTVTEPGFAEVLAVGGGGGGSGGYGAGGGAGGFRMQNSLIRPNSYPVIVGAGGATQPNIAQGFFGSQSALGTYSATGGGGAGSFGTANAGSGGSGGGGGGGNGIGGVGNAGNYIPVEGYSGGNGHSSTAAGGGGGGGGAGGNGIANQSGAGGAGSNSASSWATATGTGMSGSYAGGGGGGADSAQSVTRGVGGTGGGGDGGAAGVAGTSGVVNTGSGGGGGGRSGTITYGGGSGGSGIVIIRYPVS